MRPLGLLLVALLSLSLAACVPEPVERARGVAAEEPLFATDAEALAAAEEVYREYLRVADEVRAGGDRRLLEVVSSPAWYEHEFSVNEELEAKGLRLEGNPTVSEISLESFDRHGVRVYACHHASSVRLIDAAGIDVTPPERPDSGLLIVTLVDLEGQLVVDGSELWSNFC